MVQTAEKTANKSTEAHLKKFERFEQEHKLPAWVFPLRKAGMARFAEQGFPTTNDEDWRFTSLTPLARLPFKPVFEPAKTKITRDQVLRFTFGQLALNRLVFVNGHYVPELSLAASKGVVLKSLAAALADNDPVLQEHLARHAETEHAPFTSLNTAFFQDGAFLRVPAGHALETPIHLLYINTAKESGATAQPRNLIVLGKDAQATVLETYVSTVDAPYFTNAVTELKLDDGARLEHCKFQDESPSAFHIAAIHAQLGRGSCLLAHSLALGAKLSRNNIRGVLSGEGIECIFNGLFLTHGEQLTDHHMVVEHAAPHCASHEYYNGILDGRSKGVFHGRILVRPAAQKTDAKQTNKNLLLSDDATVDTKPQLEIYADDVKCTHGATVGQLNEESVFYLRSRGISLERARRMLIHSFAGEIIERIRQAPAREELEKLVWERLEQNPRVGEKKSV